MRKTKKAALRRNQESEHEPFLFDYDALPVREDVVELVRSGDYQHTGARLLDNVALTQRVVNRLCLRHGVERIAREEHISPASIRRARECLVAQGKMGGFVKRFVARSEEIIEAGLEAFYEGILSGQVSPGQLPVGLGIIFDKRALALGEPTSISLGATAALRPDALSSKALNAWVEALPLESESSGMRMIHEENEHVRVVVPAIVPTDSPPTVSAPATRPPAAKDGGGGSDRRNGDDFTDAFPAAILEQKSSL